MDRADARREELHAGTAVSPPGRATRIARWTAFGTTLLFAVYVAARLRGLPPAWRSTGRLVAAIAVVVWYYLTYRIVKHVATALSLVALVTAGASAQTSLSIYSDGRVVVRRTVAQALSKGSNRVTIALENVDPATVFSPDSALTVVSVTLRRASDRAAALESAEGQTLSFVRGKGDTVRATVVRGNPPQYRLPDGRMLLVEPGEPLFPAELVRSTSEASLVLEASKARPAAELAYLAEGARWSATYQVLLAGGGGTALVSGNATVASQGLDADSAAVQLVAGTINRARSAPPGPSPIMARQMVAVEGTAPAEEAVGETHVYALPGRMSLAPGVSVTIALFPRTSVAATQEYVVSGALPFRGYLPTGAAGSQAEPNRVPVEVWYTLKRARGTPFGDRPLPGGVIQLYQADSAGRAQLLGEASSAHQAPGRDVRVQAGAAFDLTAERVQTDYAQEQIPPPRKGLAPRQRVTASYRVTISNAKATPVAVSVREVRAGVWSIVTSSVPAEKISATEMRFRVTVPAEGEATLTYTVQVDL
ncbi:MAG TPA: hypothetical protein VLV16_03040 [Gemmatimonadales bacterium]|nr:hypothetical protein [Gemmatimonadales bacterium]